MSKRNKVTPPAAFAGQGRLVDLQYILEDLGLQAQSTVYRLIHRQGFPAPVRIGRLSRWRLAEIEAWKSALAPGFGARPSRSPGRPKGSVDNAAPVAPEKPSRARRAA